MMRHIRSDRGFTLIEIVVVIIILGILSTIAVTRMGSSIGTARFEQTKKELDQLAFAIVGNPELYADGARSDFGYVGDVGALPPDLDALTQNPGGYATWDGPYINRGMASDDFKKDAWGTAYTYTDTLLRSSGSGSNIDKKFAGSSVELLSNSVTGTVLDADMTMPGASYRDSVTVQLLFPDGSGSMTTANVNPDNHGYFSFSGIPIGNQTLRVIYVPDSDTMNYDIAVYPNRDVRLGIIFPADLW
jgi:general secretion pathway protein G